MNSLVHFPQRTHKLKWRMLLNQLCVVRKYKNDSGTKSGGVNGN